MLCREADQNQHATHLANGLCVHLLYPFPSPALCLLCAGIAEEPKEKSQFSTGKILETLRFLCLNECKVSLVAICAVI